MSPEPTTSKPSDVAAPAPAERSAPTIRYLDRAEMEETFADSISGLIFDGQTLRIEFAVTRFDEVKPNTAITGRRYPACRLVLPPGSARVPVVVLRPFSLDEAKAESKVSAFDVEQRDAA